MRIPITHLHNPTKIAVAPRDKFRRGDRVRVNSGPFEKLEATVDTVTDWNRKVHIIISIFGRKTPVDIDENQLDRIE